MRANQISGLTGQGRNTASMSGTTTAASTAHSAARRTSRRGMWHWQPVAIVASMSTPATAINRRAGVHGEDRSIFTSSQDETRRGGEHRWLGVPHLDAFGVLRL